MTLPSCGPVPDGCLAVPAGKIASVVTFLEMTEAPADLAPPSWPETARPRRLGADDLPAYRELFRAVGSPWLWFSRLRLDEAQLGSILADPLVEAYALDVDGRPQGLLELDRRPAPDIEIAFLGLVPEALGRGLGRALMQFALARAWDLGPRRVWLHTCTLDHPAALGFYLRAGFRATRRAIEVADDPRLTGALPRGAAPDVPIIAADPPAQGLAGRAGARRPAQRPDASG